MLSNTLNMVSLVWNHPANRNRKVLALTSAAAWQAYKRTVRRPIAIEAYGMKFRCYPDSKEAGRMIYFNKLPDPSEMQFAQRFLRAGDSVIDAGANVGVYTLYFASIVGKTGHVLAIEPGKPAFDRLCENVEINNLTSVKTVQVAVSDFSGAADFTEGGDTGNRLRAVGTGNRPIVSVEVRTLDSLIGCDQYALGKMDVEGAEPMALKGAENSLGRSTPPVWMIEMTNRTLNRSGSSVLALTEWLSSNGYDLWTYDETSNLLSAYEDRPRRPGVHGDAIAVARHRLSWVKERIGAR